MSQFVVSAGDFGQRLTATGPWSAATQQAAEGGVSELYLNYALGWDAKTTEFVSSLSHLKALHLLAPDLADVRALEELRELRSLRLEVSPAARLHLGAFPQLEEFSGFWSNVEATLWLARSLERLRLIGFPSAVPSGFGKLPRLRAVALYSAGVEQLGDISALENLGSLSLAHCRRLRKLDAIDALQRLTELSLEDCKAAVGSLEALRPLRQLQTLILHDCGTIESLGPLEDLRELRTVRFTGSTSIADGDLSVLRELPKLRNLGFKQRKHYSPAWRSFAPQLFESTYHLNWS